MTIEASISRSNRALHEIVWPAIKPHACDLLGVPNLMLQMVETEGSAIATDLDMHTGIDAYVRCGSIVQGVATRVQFSGDYQTSTVRTRTGYGNTNTELSKRVKALTVGGLYPHLTLQAYTVGGRLLSAAVARTSQLYTRDVLSSPYVYKQVNGYDGSEFLVIPWSVVPPDYIRTVATPNREEMK